MDKAYRLIRIFYAFSSALVRLCFAFSSAKNKKNKTPRSPAQLAMNAKMSLAMKFLTYVTNFVNVGFSTSVGPGQTSHNIAVSRMLLTGIKGSYPNYELDYPNIQLTDGKLRLPDNIQAKQLGDDIVITWNVPAYEGDVRARDQIMAVCCDGKGFATKLLSGARITDGMEVLKGHAMKRQKPFHVYVSFISDDRKLVAKSVYTGMIE